MSDLEHVEGLRRGGVYDSEGHFTVAWSTAWERFARHQAANPANYLTLLVSAGLAYVRLSYDEHPNRVAFHRTFRGQAAFSKDGQHGQGEAA